MGLSQFSPVLLKESAGRLYDIAEQCERLADLLVHASRVLNSTDVGNMQRAVRNRADSLSQNVYLIKSFAAALGETADVYAAAEKKVGSLFAVDNSSQRGKPSISPIPRSPLVKRNLAMPEWLESAVFRYISDKASRGE